MRVAKGQDTDKERRATVELLASLRELDGMTVSELAEKHRELFGVPTRTRNKPYLRKRLAWQLQARAEGSLSPRALERIAELAPQAPVRWNQPAAVPDNEPSAARPPRDHRLPPAGAVLVRWYEGSEHRVKVLDDGFEYASKHYRSLSAIARRITSTSWNGFLFFFGRDAANRRVGGES